MKINGRLLLLVVVTGLFVRVWKTNEHPRSRPVVRLRSQAVELTRSRIVGPVEQAVETAPVSHRRDGDERPSLEENWTALTCPIPLPSGIAAGTYRVVNDTGRVAKLTIEADHPLAVGQTTPAATEFLMTTAGAERWFLIRLRAESATAPLDVNQTDATQIPISPVFADEVPPVANRKFDFSGYESGPSPMVELSDRAANEQAVRPTPPELPTSL